MNLDKAREHYSAYYDGSLDRGLRQNFDRMVIENDELAADYRAYEVFMDRISTMSHQTPACPEDLFEKISARIDRHVYEQRQTTKTGFLSVWLRPLAIGTAAVAVLGLGFLQMNGAFKGEANRAVIIPGPSEMARLKVEPTDTGVRLSYPNGQAVVIRKDGEVIEKVPHGMENKPVSNPDSKPQIFEILVGTEATLIALPGTEKWTAPSSQGTLSEFALAAAGKYQVPVMLQVRNVNAIVTWDLSSEKIMEAATPTLKTLNLRCSLSTSGARSLLQVEDH